MNRIKYTSLILLIFSTSVFAQNGFENRPITNNLWMATGYTLNEKEFVMGLGPIGSGISDKVQVGTNFLLLLVRHYTLNVKISLLDLEDGALATGIELGNFNTRVHSITRAFSSISPYLAYSKKIGEKTNFHVTGQLSYFASEYDINDADVKSTSTGTSIGVGLEYSRSNKTKFLAETGYDITYHGMRLGGGVLWGWSKFRFKLGLAYFRPEAVRRGFVSPKIGLWWRFGGE